MKLLIVTQAIDLDDPLLGFFHQWVLKLSSHYERIEVICLSQGRSALPENVRVHSLGKERGRRSRLTYALDFIWLIESLRHNYDAVLVHMNPEYVILGKLFWRLGGKKVFFWYNHPQKDLRLRFAARLADKIFYTSAYAATAKFTHAVKMPAGIDTSTFSPTKSSRTRNALYMQGRVMSSKRVEIALSALRLVRQTIAATLTIVGPEDATYAKKLRSEFADLLLSGAVRFLGAKPNTETPALYSAHTASINLAAAGHFDKTVLESMACETPVVISSKAFAGLVPAEWVVPEGDPKALAATLIRLLELPEAAHERLGSEERTAVVAGQSLDALVSKVVAEISL